MTPSLLSAPVALLLLGATAETALWTLRRRHPGSRCLPAVRLAAWFMRPVMAAAAVNLWMLLSGSGMSNPKTYPFYANPWSEDGATASFRFFCQGPGVPVWLPVAALAGLAFVAAAALAGALPSSRLRGWALAPLLAALAALAAVFWVSIASMPRGFFGNDGQDSSFLAPWHDTGSTMLYAAQFGKPDAAGYVRNFKHIQSRLDHVVHAKSHPPFASLAVRWIGAAAGVNVNSARSYRNPRDRLRYALGQTVVSSLNLVLVFFLGMALFDRRTGLLAAVLWAVAPSVAHYATFAPDMNYAPFFHGALLFSWLVAAAPSVRRALAFSVPLGLCFAALVLLNFSWCVATAFFAAFAFAAARREGRGWRDALWRVVPPLVLMVLVSGAVMLAFRIDYFAIYRNSSGFVSQFYRHRSLAEAALALAGGQVEWLFLAGPLACAGFFAFLRAARRGGEWPLQRLFAWTLLAVLAIPFVFGPPALKHETARCWIWAASVPVVLAARHWSSRGGTRLCAAVVFSSAALSVFLRFFFQFKG